MMDLLDFEAPKPIPTAASTSITPDLLGDILGGGATSKPKVTFQPVMVNTQQFGELWMQLPPVDKRGALTLP